VVSVVKVMVIGVVMGMVMVGAVEVLVVGVMMVVD